MARIIGEEQVVEAADMLIANTDLEAKQLINLYDADPGRVEVVHPGVDLTVFRPQERAVARAALGLPEDAHVLLFAGRIQPLKAPDVLLRAVAVLLEETPALRSRLVVPVVGGPSGSGLEHPESLAQLTDELGLTDVVRFVPPVAQPELARWCAAATLVAVPSYNESFGLVAIEAQATGTPVVAAAVGGLTTVVRDGHSGLLVDGHEPRDWAATIRRVLEDDALHARLERRRRRPGRPVRLGAHGGAHAGGLRAGPQRDARVGLVTTPAGADPAQVIRDHLAAHEIEHQEATEGVFSLVLPGEKKLQTPVRLDVGAHALGVHAFVCRRPDENHERVYRWLLERNLKMYGVAFAVDAVGDIYLDARLPLSIVTPDELDRLLGSVLSYADDSFNTILELGFASSIRKEWEWRKLRGEPTHNLEAFRGWLDR